MAGEIAIVTLTTSEDSGNNLNDTTDTILFKIGNGKNRFSELGWTSSLAADVYEWAKAAQKPSYSYGDASLTGFGSAATKNFVTTITDADGVPTSSAVKTYITGLLSNYGSGDVKGPNTGVVNNLVVFGTTDGKTIKDSGKKIVTSIGNGSNNEIPTTKAVLNYIGTLSTALRNRLNGSL